jgi:hypothetical protein
MPPVAPPEHKSPPCNSPVEMTDSPASSAFLIQVQQWHDKFSFGKLLRNSTSPDFIAAVVTGQGDTETSGHVKMLSGDRENEMNIITSSGSRKKIMESIGWLVPAITAISSGCSVLQLIPPLPSAHLLLVIR